MLGGGASARRSARRGRRAGGGQRRARGRRRPPCRAPRRRGRASPPTPPAAAADAARRAASSDSQAADGGGEASAVVRAHVRVAERRLVDVVGRGLRARRLVAHHGQPGGGRLEGGGERRAGVAVDEDVGGGERRGRVRQHAERAHAAAGALAGVAPGARVLGPDGDQDRLGQARRRSAPSGRGSRRRRCARACRPEAMATSTRASARQAQLAPGARRGPAAPPGASAGTASTAERSGAHPAARDAPCGRRRDAC